MAGHRSLFAEGDDSPFQRDRGPPPGDLDITPMIDVTFLLLIFLLLVVVSWLGIYFLMLSRGGIS